MMEFLPQMLGTAILLACFAYLYHKWFKGLSEPEDVSGGASRDRTPAGQDKAAGADKLRRKAEHWARTHDAKVVGPLQLSWGELAADFDFVLVGWFGVLAVQCLGYGGTIYGSADQAGWTQEKNGQRHSFENPTTARQTGARVLRGVLMEKDLRTVASDCVTVFTGEGVQLALPRSLPHHTPDSFAALLRTDRYTADKGVDVEAVCKVLKGQS